MRGHIRARGKGTWAIVIEQERGPDGKRRQKWHTVRGAKREAERELARLLHALETGEPIPPQRLTVREYLDRWLNDAVRRRVGASSYERYESTVRVHLAPGLGNVLLSRLSPLQIQGLYSRLLDEGSPLGAGPLAARSVREVHGVLHQALAQAVRWQLLGRNPSDAVDVPSASDASPSVFSEADLAKLLRAAQGQPIYLPIILALATGMRRNEILGLRWNDVDLETGRVAVQVALVHTRQGLHLQPPKTPKSRRAIDLPRWAADLLRRHQPIQASQSALLGTLYEDHDLIVCRDDGRPMVPRVVTRQFSKVAARAGFPGRRLHDLRHTHATLLLEQGIHPKVVSERLGHSRVSMTLDRYSHVLPHLQKEATERLDACLRSIIPE